MFPFHSGYYNFTRRPFVRSLVRPFVRSFVIVIGIQWIRNTKPDDEGKGGQCNQNQVKEEGGREGGRGLKYSSPDDFVRQL